MMKKQPYGENLDTLEVGRSCSVDFQAATSDKLTVPLPTKKKRVKKVEKSDTKPLEPKDPDMNICTICYDRPTNCVFMNCMHQCACYECGMDIMRHSKNCPMCREPIQEVRVVYKS